MISLSATTSLTPGNVPLRGSGTLSATPSPFLALMVPSVGGAVVSAAPVVQAAGPTLQQQPVETPSAALPAAPTPGQLPAATGKTLPDASPITPASLPPATDATTMVTARPKLLVKTEQAACAVPALPQVAPVSRAAATAIGEQAEERRSTDAAPAEGPADQPAGAADAPAAAAAPLPPSAMIPTASTVPALPEANAPQGSTADQAAPVLAPAAPRSLMPRSSGAPIDASAPAMANTISPEVETPAPAIAPDEPSARTTTPILTRNPNVEPGPALPGDEPPLRQTLTTRDDAPEPLTIPKRATTPRRPSDAPTPAATPAAAPTRHPAGQAPASTPPSRTALIQDLPTTASPTRSIAAPSATPAEGGSAERSPAAAAARPVRIDMPAGDTEAAPQNAPAVRTATQPAMPDRFAAIPIIAANAPVAIDAPAIEARTVPASDMPLDAPAHAAVPARFVRAAPSATAAPAPLASPTGGTAGPLPAMAETNTLPRPPLPPVSAGSTDPQAEVPTSPAEAAVPIARVLRADTLPDASPAVPNVPAFAPAAPARSTDPARPALPETFVAPLLPPATGAPATHAFTAATLAQSTPQPFVASTVPPMQPVQPPAPDLAATRIMPDATNTRSPAPQLAPALQAAPTPAPAPAPAPIPLVAPGVTAPAGTLFAAAMEVSRREERPRGETGMPTSAADLVASFSATAPAAPHALEPAAERSLDMSQQRWPHAMLDQIERLRDAADAVDTRIRLVPDQLGGIDIAVRQEGDTLHVRFHAEQPQTRQLLAEAQPRLADAAEQRGLRLGQAEIGGGSAGDPGRGTAGQFSQQQQPQHQAGRPAPAAATRRADDTGEAPTTDIRIA